MGCDRCDGTLFRDEDELFCLACGARVYKTAHVTGIANWPFGGNWRVRKPYGPRKKLPV